MPLAKKLIPVVIIKSKLRSLFQTTIFTVLVVKQAILDSNATGKVLVMDIAAKPTPHSVDGLTSRWLKLYYYLNLKQAH